MSQTREFRKNPTQALKMYSNFFLPMKVFLEGQIAKLNLNVDIDNLYPINDAWAYFCDDPIAMINRRKIRMKRKEAPDGHIKRPMSAFMWFINESRGPYIAKNPTVKFTEVTKELSKKWNKMTEKEKIPYQKKFTDDKARYESERKVILDKVEEDSNNKEASKPKKALNAYLFFMKDESIKDKLNAEHEKLSAEGINKTKFQFMAFKWEQMNEKEKEKYVKQAAEDSVRFSKEMEEYNKKFKTENA